MEQDTSRVISVCEQTRHFNVSQQFKPISVQTNQCTDQLNIMHKQKRNSSKFKVYWQNQQKTCVWPLTNTNE